MSNRKQESLFWGMILLLIGLLFLLDNFGVDINVWHIIGKFWPMILIGIGLKNIWYHYSKRLQKEE